MSLVFCSYSRAATRWKPACLQLTRDDKQTMQCPLWSLIEQNMPNSATKNASIVCCRYKKARLGAGLLLSMVSQTHLRPGKSLCFDFFLLVLLLQHLPRTLYHPNSCLHQFLLLQVLRSLPDWISCFHLLMSALTAYCCYCWLSSKKILAFR